ncbi:MAG: chain-length determining protein [Bacteroidaceae bacterium]|nr:chain-length determining protein [Bacteroidaceae bacterium]
MEENKEQKTLDLGKIVRKLWANKKRFYKIWIITFVLSCIWILPQPRFYKCEVMLAPEQSGETAGGGLSSLASSFGFNLGSLGGQDAIYPELYPDLFQSPEFIVGLYNVQVTTKDGKLTTTYFDYMKSHQKQNLLTWPFRWTMKKLKSYIEEEDKTPRAEAAGDIDPFRMNRKDYMLMESIIENISCAVDKKTTVVTIKVRDQDPLVCATMTDSIKRHLQDFIIQYRTCKVKEDVVHYQQMCDSAAIEYDKAMKAYSRYCDAHQNVILQSYQSERDKLENELSLKQTSLTAMETQLQATKVKLQEKTPAFTTLKSATVPIKPAGPKRMLFVLGMLILVSTIKSYLLIKDDIK